MRVNTSHEGTREAWIAPQELMRGLVALETHSPGGIGAAGGCGKNLRIKRSCPTEDLWPRLRRGLGFLF